MELHGRKALVTGATGGIGHAVARALHARGAKLILTGRRTEVLEPLARELGAEPIAVDLAVPAEIDRLVRAAGEVDVLVANAGLSSAGPLEAFAPGELGRSIDVNLRAPMLLARGLVPAMAARGSGQLVFISSLSGMTGQPGAAVYSATKFGLRGFAQALRAELRSTGIGVSAVLPGFVREAGMFHEAGARSPWYLGSSSPDAVAQAVVRSIERDRGEIVVAPPLTRAMTRFASAAPLTAATAARLLGGDRITAKIIGDLAAGQRRD